jgi:hypothetical protein
MSVRLSDLQPGTDSSRRRRMDAPYGTNETFGKTVPLKDISSFKLSVLQVVLCEREVEAHEGSGANVVMGVGTSNGASTLQDKLDTTGGSNDFGCHKICGEAPLTDEIAAGWFGTTNVQNAADTDAQIRSYADGLTWTDLKDTADLDSFGTSCTAAAFPVGTFRWGWIIYAPIGKMTASVTLPAPECASGDGDCAETKTLYTKAGAMDSVMGASWGQSAETGSISDSPFTTGPAEESLFWVYGARGQQNMFSYRLSEPLTTVAGTTYTLSLAYDLEGIVNAYADAAQPTSPNSCYPDHPFRKIWPEDKGITNADGSAMKNDDGEVITDTHCCTTPTTPGLNRNDASDCQDWNIYSLMDKEFNAFDVGYLQLSPILTAATNTVWRQKYSLTVPEAVVSRAKDPIVFRDDAETAGLDCQMIIQLLYVTGSVDSPPASGNTPLAASIGLTLLLPRPALGAHGRRPHAARGQAGRRLCQDLRRALAVATPCEGPRAALDCGQRRHKPRRDVRRILGVLEVRVVGLGGTRGDDQGNERLQLL